MHPKHQRITTQLAKIIDEIEAWAGRTVHEEAESRLRLALRAAGQSLDHVGTAAEHEAELARDLAVDLELDIERFMVLPYGHNAPP